MLSCGALPFPRSSLSLQETAPEMPPRRRGAAWQGGPSLNAHTRGEREEAAVSEIIKTGHGENALGIEDARKGGTPSDCAHREARTCVAAS